MRAILCICVAVVGACTEWNPYYLAAQAPDAGADLVVWFAGDDLADPTNSLGDANEFVGSDMARDLADAGPAVDLVQPPDLATLPDLVTLPDLSWEWCPPSPDCWLCENDLQPPHALTFLCFKRPLKNGACECRRWVEHVVPCPPDVLAEIQKDHRCP